MESIATQPFSRSKSQVAGLEAGKPPTRLQRLARAGATLVLVISLLGLASFASRQTATPAAARVAAAPVYLPNIHFLRLASLRYQNAVADFLWFRTINYFGEHYHSDHLYPWLARMCEIVTDLDPRAMHVYRFAGVILPWEAQRPDDGIALLEKGVRVFPDSWQLHFFLGFNYYYFKQDLQRAIQHVRRASELPGAPPFVTRFATILYATEYGTKTARAFLENLMNTPEGAGLRPVIREHLKQLDLTDQLEQLQGAMKSYTEKFGHRPSDLSALVAAGFLSEIPREPFGGAYQYDPQSGAVTSSSGHNPVRLYQSETRKEILGHERGD